MLKNAIEILNQEGIILYPTATVWGLGCSAFSCSAIEKIYTLKKRERNKPLIVLVKDQEQLQALCGALPSNILEIANSNEPTSIVYQSISGLPDCILAENGSLAIRITKHPICKALIENMNAPLVSTSANTAGIATPKSFAEVEDRIKMGVDYIVEYADETNDGKSSRLFSLDSNDFSLTLLRG